MKRISYLDGHRGIAILLVVLYHAFSRWTELVPYGNDFADFPLFRFGYLGVELFFLISGFVILMTLEKCNSFTEFMYHRWLRLFPAMLVCSLFIYVTAQYFIERPNGIPVAKDLIPGMSFIYPYLLGKLTGMEFNNIENSFWSLYVEFKFYIIAAIFYSLWGSKNLVVALFLCFITYFVFKEVKLLTDHKAVYYASAISSYLGFKYFGWFAAGASYYMFVKEDNKIWFLFGAIICLISSIILAVEAKSFSTFIAIAMISLFFSTSLISNKLQQLISNRFLLALGFVSYPLYLLHENMMIAIIIKANYILPSYLSITLPFLAIGLIFMLAYFIAKKIERPLKKAIELLFSKLQLFHKKRLKN